MVLRLRFKLLQQLAEAAPRSCRLAIATSDLGRCDSKGVDASGDSGSCSIVTRTIPSSWSVTLWDSRHFAADSLLKSSDPTTIE